MSRSCLKCHTDTNWFFCPECYYTLIDGTRTSYKECLKWQAIADLEVLNEENICKAVLGPGLKEERDLTAHTPCPRCGISAITHGGAECDQEQ